jgi:hypothetical protein
MSAEAKFESEETVEFSNILKQVIDAVVEDAEQGKEMRSPPIEPLARLSTFPAFIFSLTTLL